MSNSPVIPMEPIALAEAIALPLENWEGNCHGVAEAILRKAPTQGMRLVRGHFGGFISKMSVFSDGPQQHSWLRLQDGRIFDPTRWTMDQPDRPYIYCGVNDAYDEAGLVLAAQSRAWMMGSFSMIGRTNEPEEAILRALSAAWKPHISDLLEALGLAQTDDPGPRQAHQILNALQGPVEHLAKPVEVYTAAAAVGLRPHIKIDCWTRVMEPEKVMPTEGTNFFFADPPGEDLSTNQKLFRVFAHFLSIEEREERIHGELADLGYELEDLHDAINAMERALSIDPDLIWMPRSERDTLCHVAMDILGKGFGGELRVERFADGLGLDREALDQALIDFAEPAGLDLCWIYPPRPRTEEASNDPSPSM